MKVLNVIVEGKNQLIRYSKTKNSDGLIVFSVETTIPNHEHFQFLIRNGKAEIFLVSEEDRRIKSQIISQIDKVDAKG